MDSRSQKDTCILSSPRRRKLLQKQSIMMDSLCCNSVECDCDNGDETIPLAASTVDTEEGRLPTVNPSNARDVSKRSPSSFALVFVMIASLVLISRQAFTRSSTSSIFSSDQPFVPFIFDVEFPNAPPPDNLIEINGQDRPNEIYGSQEAGFVHTQEPPKEERHEQMNYLQQVRTNQNACGKNIENWEKVSTTSEYKYFRNADVVLGLAKGNTTAKVSRYICDVPHPGPEEARNDIQVHIERIGPFRSTGNSDWSIFTNYKPCTYCENADDPPTDELLMREILSGRDIHVRGTFVSLIQEDGTFIGYPPLHMHHAHLHPYANRKETVDRIFPKRRGSHGDSPAQTGIVGGGSAYMDHHILAQQHGDSICHDPTTGQDDFSCLLHVLPHGHGMLVNNSSGFRLDFEVNDVRTADTTKETGQPLEDLEWYLEVVVMWTTKPQIPVTFMHIAAPESGSGPSTYAIPIDDSSTMIYYNYTHDWRDDDFLQVDDGDERLAAGVNGVEGLGPGTIFNIIGHVHHVMFDSLFIFKESNKSRGVFQAIDSLRPKDQYLPYIPECNGETLDQTKERAIQLAIDQGGGKLVCEVTKPNLIWLESPTGRAVKPVSTVRVPQDPSFAYRDRRMDLHCMDNIRLEPGDTLTFVSFSKSRPASTKGHIKFGSQGHKNAGLFERGLFAQSEHTVVRMDFVSDKARDSVVMDATRQAKLGALSTNPGDTSLNEPTVATSANFHDFYAPPALYLTQRWPRSTPDEGCYEGQLGKEWFSFLNKGIPGWNYTEMQNCGKSRTNRLKSMMHHCPSSISLHTMWKS